MLKRIAMAGALACGLAACARDDSAAKSVPSPPSTTAALPATATKVASIAARVGVPSFVWTGAPTSVAPSAPLPATPELAARAHLTRLAPYYRFAPDQVAALELRDVHDTGRGAIIARFGRRIDGIEVFGEQIAVAIHDAGISLDVADLDTPAAASGDYQTVRIRPTTQSLALRDGTEPARIKSVYFRGATKRLRPAYYVETDLGPSDEGEPRYFAYLVSATDGSVLWKRNLTAYDSPFSYRVYADNSGLFQPWDGPEGTSATPHPTGTLDKFQAPFVPANLVTISSLQAVGVNDPWLPLGATQTLGNNVDAYLDITMPDGFTPGSDFRGSVSAPGVFDYTFDTGVDANANTTQQKAAVTQLFYNLNWFHDWYYAAGFTEQAGNAQFSNYGRGGIEGDGLRAEAQDSSGKDNANMSTPSDGARPRMQMYLWDFGSSSLTIAAPSAIAGTYTTGAASFAPNNFNVTSNIVRANPVDGCAPLVGTYTGAIVLIDRGGAACGSQAFATKSQNAQAAGAAGVIIANVATSASPTVPANPGGTPTVPITIGVLAINLADGDAIRARLAAGDTVTGTIARTSLLRDGDIDNQIVAHEWGHYISNRLIFNAIGLGNNMGNGMGEGWADFHAMLITVRPEDTANPTNANWNGVYALGGYALGSFTTDPYYFGVRRYPYSTDMTKDPLTFKHISDEAPLPDGIPRAFDGPHAEVHDIGEIWATMLWECYASLLRDTIGDSPRLTFAEARDRMRDYIVASYKLTPANPTLVEARDALLAAVLVNDPIDYQHFTVAFAKRGAGVFAVAPDRIDDTNSGIVESYASGAAVVATDADLTDDVQAVCNADGILDSGETGTLHVTFHNTGNQATAALTATVSSTNEALTFPDGSTITIPAIPILGTAEGTVRVAATGLSGVSTLNFSVQVADAGAGAPPPKSFSFIGNADQAPNQSFTDGAESSHVVWTVISSSPDVFDPSRWQRVATSALDHVYHCPSAPLAATVDFVSPFMSVAPGQSLTLSFRHRYSFETDKTTTPFTYFDGGVIETSIDGGATWTDVGQAVAGYNGTLYDASDNPIGGRPAFVGDSLGYPAYVNASLNLGPSFGGQLVLVRFRLGSDAGGTSPGWDLDDITFGGVASPPFDAIIAQPVCNNPPIATVGLNQAVPDFGPAPTFTPTTVTLDGSASFDPDGSPLSFAWTQVAGPAVVLSDATAAQPTFTAPDVPATTLLVFQLVVSDGTTTSAPQETAVFVVNVNRPPVANAGPPQIVDERTTVTLNGTASSDPDGDALRYAWSAPPGITLVSTSTARTSFVAPEVTADTAFTFGLVVSDGAAQSAASTVTIVVHNVNRAPVASAGTNQSVVEGTPVTLDGTASVDPDGDALAYAWTAPPGVTLVNPASASPTFDAPNVGPNGRTFAFSLVVTDPSGATSPPSTVQVAVSDRRRRGR